MKGAMSCRRKLQLTTVRLPGGDAGHAMQCMHAIMRMSIVCTWAQDERPADLHMAQPNVPVSKTGQFPPNSTNSAGCPSSSGLVGYLVYQLSYIFLLVELPLITPITNYQMASSK
jgi:hypothetical protein